MPLHRAPLRHLLLSLACSLASVLFAIGQAGPLITQPVDENNLAVLRGNTHPLAQPQYDQGAAPATLMLNRMMLVLKRSPAQEDALRQFIDDQQDKSSPNFHKWLTPDQYGQQFGASDKDVQTVVAWLKSHEFQVTQISRGRTVIEFSGSVAQVQEAFHTSIHNYLINGQTRLSNASDPQIPAALAPVVAGPLSLNSFSKKSMNQFVGTYSKISGKLDAANPQFTFGCQGYTCYALVPYDFAAIYNVLPLWTSGIDGTGQTIAIVGRTNINIQDVRDFRSLFGLAPNDPQIILNGPDPGINGDESEADIDIQWSGAVATNATIDFVTSASTETSDGVDLSAEYIVDNNLAPVMSESYGQCELGLGTAGNQFFNALWAQAAAQGITVFVSSGDNGSAGCDFNLGYIPQPALYGLAVNGIASTPFNVAVGGTDFQDAFNPLSYWNSINDPVTQASAKGYIPEVTWNDTCTNAIWAQIGFSTNAETNCNDPRLGAVYTIAGSGGLSNCTVNSQQLGTCSGGYAKPSWQTGTGVPSDGKRDLPDVSLFASNGFEGNFYIVCQSDLTGYCSLNSIAGFGGTSVASPAFAGIMALVNQQTGTRQGNANYVFYKLATQQPTAFHDIPSASTIAMPCATGSPNCTVKVNGHQYGVQSGYSTTTGYDLATGLGTVNVSNLVNEWSTVTFKPSTTTLSLSPTTITHGQPLTVNATVAPASGSGTPTGNFSLLTSTGKSVQDFTLAGGSFSGTTSMLPGGTYTVTAHYGGDPTYGGSDSTPPISVTVNKEASKSVARVITFDSNGNITNQNATSAVYGSPYLLRMDVTDSAGDVCGTSLACPTGTLNLTNNGLPLDAGTYLLNNLGYAEDLAVQLSGGSNVLSAQFLGDLSFNGSTGSDTVTITPALMTFSGTGLPLTMLVGNFFFLNFSVQATSSGVAPGGTFTFQLDGAPLSGTLSTWASGGQTSGTATFSGSFDASITTPGNHTLIINYSGDANYSAASASGNILAQYGTSMSINADTLNPQPNASVSLTAIVNTPAQNLPPTGRVTFFDAQRNTPLPGNVILTPITDGNGNSALQAVLSIVPSHNNLVAYAVYSGDTDYTSSNSGYLYIAVAGSDFALTTDVPSLTIYRGNSGSLQLTIDGQASYQGTVSLSASSCSGLPLESICSFSLPTVTGSGQDVLTVTTTYPHARSQQSSLKMLNGWTATLGFGVVGIFLLGRPARSWICRLSLLLVVAMGLLSFGCGGGSSGGGGGGGTTDPGTPKGSYNITVTATSGTLTHTTTFTLVVN